MIFHWAKLHQLTDWLDCGWMVARCNGPMFHHEYSLLCVFPCDCAVPFPKTEG